MEQDKDGVFVVTDNRGSAPFPFSTGARGLHTFSGRAGTVHVLIWRDLEGALPCLRRAQERGHHAALFFEEAAALQFAQAVAGGQRTWADPPLQNGGG